MNKYHFIGVFFRLVLLFVLVIGQVIALEYEQFDNRSDSLTAEQLQGLDEYFSRKLTEEYLSENPESTLPKREQSSSIKPAILHCIQRSNLDPLLAFFDCHQRWFKTKH